MFCFFVGGPGSSWKATICKACVQLFKLISQAQEKSPLLGRRPTAGGIQVPLSLMLGELCSDENQTQASYMQTMLSSPLSLQYLLYLLKNEKIYFFGAGIKLQVISYCESTYSTYPRTIFPLYLKLLRIETLFWDTPG